MTPDYDIRGQAKNRSFESAQDDRDSGKNERAMDSRLRGNDSGGIHLSGATRSS
jgi:hypothetical protein